MNLEKIRKQIDAVDEKLIYAYKERKDLVKKVAQYKKINSLPVLNENREKEVCEKLVEKFGEEMKQDIYSLYPVIMNISKLQQSRQMRKISIEELLDIDKTAQNGFAPNLKVAVQGVKGAFSMIAAEQMFDSPQLFYQKTFDSVFEAVVDGKVDYGVVPIENSNAGSVNEVYDLLAKHNLYIAKAKLQKIRHCLLAKKGVEKEDIKKVYSHPQALYQCRKFLIDNDMEAINMINTASAAEYVSNQQEKQKAAIASQKTAKLYGLEILESDIQDENHNYTRFIAITKNNLKRKAANKISMVVSLEHKHGALFQLLNIIASYCVNLTKLESRPIPGSNFEFMFYFDIEGNINDKNIQELIFDIFEYSKHALYLGGYQEE